MFVFWLLSAFVCGLGLAQKLKPGATVLEHAAIGIGIGYLIGGWITYIVSYAVRELDNPKLYGNAAAITVMIIIAVLSLKDTKIQFNNSKKEIIGFGLLFIAIAISMFYVFNVRNGMLHSGATVFSDYAPHTAIIRSFSFHDNFPTQYPHYGGQDMKYHFMFQFLAGNLEYLGMRIDFAFNIPSIASLWSFLVLLFYFSKKITKRTEAGIITLIMFFCRSSFAGLEKLADAILNQDFTSFFSNAAFVGYTAHEDWGLWNYNVFLNQRHLGFGLLIGIIVLDYFVDYLDWMDETETERHMFTKEAWKVKNPIMSVCLGLLLGGISFWNGAVVVASLLILFVIALCAKNKLDFAITAFTTLLLTFFQTSFFIREKGIGIKFLLGFIADEKTFGGIFEYLLGLSGIYFIGVLIFLATEKGKKRVLTAAFLAPVIFSFTVSLTPDVTVNHKYIMIAVIFLNIIWSDNLWKLWHSRFALAGKAVAMLLFIVLIFTGAYDLITIYNADKIDVSVNINSELTRWLKENVKEDEMVLVDQDAMSETSLSGVMMYNGWPYYAWSAGYDTDRREEIVKRMRKETDDVEEVRIWMRSEGIDYVVIEKAGPNECFSNVGKTVYEDHDNIIVETKRENKIG